MPTLGNALLEALRAYGAREIFGIPGDFVLPFFKLIEESGTLPYYTLSHEPAVGFAADSAARFRGSISVAVVTWGAGAFNLVNPIAGAFAERSPVVVISGAPGVPERAAGLQLHHMARALDTQARVFREITCDQAILDDPARAAGEIARVLRSAQEFSLPVYIELPRDMVGAETGPVAVLAHRPADPDALAECADEILGAAARRPPPGGDGGRGDAPLRRGGKGRRAGAGAWHPGGHHLHGPRPAVGASRRGARHLSGGGR